LKRYCSVVKRIKFAIDLQLLNTETKTFQAEKVEQVMKYVKQKTEKRIKYFNEFKQWLQITKSLANTSY